MDYQLKVKTNKQSKCLQTFHIANMVTIVIYIIIIMITTGATAVSKLLMYNNTLQRLDVGDNTIGDDGLSVIVEQLHHITTLTRLDVKECGLSVKGIVWCVCVSSVELPRHGNFLYHISRKFISRYERISRYRQK